ncbi:unnamed protein product [Linum trigynum]|uniref:Uncharacterized protein n=1 Tax=Linum trigynum TaxID=586398 RepID=A0AAV2G210_9ROSI
MEGTEVCQTEDAILALFENLVDLKLPAKSGSGFTPSLADEEVIAKQIHAVVLLYNYYHRRQHPELNFMNFESFCKLAVILRPNLLPYMKLTRSSNDTVLDDLENQLSLTEKNIMDACNIAVSLDASKEAPAVNGSTVSRVAVLLVDSTKQKALLQFGSITDGVWSVVEKDVAVVDLSKEHSGDSNLANKKRRIIKGPSPKREESTTEDGLKKAATLAVNEATGIGQDDLCFLESHIVCSASKENTGMRFYISQYTEAENNNSLCQVPIKDLIKSLQGPLFSKTSFGWIITPVVEYFHLLPYARILADWMNSACNQSSMISKSPKRNDQSGMKSKALMPKDENVSSDTLVQHPETEKQTENDESSMISLANFTGPRNMEVDALPVIASRNKDMGPNIVNAKPANQKIASSNHESSNDLIIFDKAEKPNTLVTQEIDKGRGRNVFKSGVNRNHMEVDASPVIKLKKEEICGNVAKAVKPAYPEIEENVLKNSKILTISDKVKKPSTQEIAEDRCRDVVISDQNCSNIAVNPDAKPAVHHLPLVEYKCSVQDIEKMFSLIASKDKELSEAALKVLMGKRDKLSFQQRDIEDQIAQYDKKILRLLNGGDDMALKIESFLELCNDTSFLRTVTRKNQPSAQSNEMLTLLGNGEDDSHTPCEALDNVCYKNNWILPTYRLLSVNGGFVASVIVKGDDTDWSSTGGEVCLNPRDARESVASQILDKICNSSTTTITATVEH